MKDKIILAVRYDGVYRQASDRLEAADIEAVRKFRKDGNIFGVYTDRDVFEVLAIFSFFQGEYDFITCSHGAFLLAKGHGIVGGTDLTSVGSGNDRPAHVTLDSIPPYLLHDLFALFESAGMTGMTVDTPCFRGGTVMGCDFADEYANAGGIGCFVRYWYDGMFFNRPVGREALSYVFPVSRCVVRFKNALSAECAANIAKEKYPDHIRIYPGGTHFTVSPAKADYKTGILSYLDLTGIEKNNVWIADNCADENLFSTFRGIAVNCRSTATEYTASNVIEAIEIVKNHSI